MSRDCDADSQFASKRFPLKRVLVVVFVSLTEYCRLGRGGDEEGDELGRFVGLGD